jgi:hypothetical protein
MIVVNGFSEPILRKPCFSGLSVPGAGEKYESLSQEGAWLPYTVDGLFLW